MGIRVKTLSIIFCIVLVYAFYYLTIPKLLNLEDISPIISRFVKTEYGFNVKFDNPKFKMGYMPSVWIRADKFNILNDDKTSALTIEKPVIKVSLIPLMFGRVNLKYFSAKNIFAELYCDDKLRISLGQYLLLKSSDFMINISGSRIYVDKFLVNLNDKIRNEKIILDGKYFNIDRYAKNRYLKTSLDFDIRSMNKVSSINLNVDTKLPFNAHLDDYHPEIDISATNLNLAEFTNYINYLTQGNISGISGIVNLDIHSDKEIFEQKHYISNILIDNLAVKTSLFEKDYIYPHKIHVKSDYLLENDTIKVPSFLAKTPDISVKLSGKIDKVSSKRPIPNLNLKIKNARAEKLLELFPYCNKFDELAKINVSIIKKTGFFSDVNVDLNITDNFEKPLLYGSIDVTNAFVERPIANAPANADINIKYIGDKLNLKVFVPTNINQSVSVEGTIDAYDENSADLHITSTDKINLAETERILMPVHKVFNFLLGPVPIMGFSGFGSIDLTVKGTKKNPHTFGWFRTSKATTFFDDIPSLVLTNADSLLTFDDFNTTFMLNSGLVNGKPVSIEGTCDLSGKFNFNAKFHNQNANNFLNILKLSPMLKDFSKSVELINKADGLIDFNTKISGHLLDISELQIGKNVHAKGEIILHSVTAKLGNLKNNVQNITGNLKFEDFNVNLNLSSSFGVSKINLIGKIEKNIGEIAFNSNYLKIIDIINAVDNKWIGSDLSSNSDTSYMKISGKYNGDISNIDLKKLKTDGNIYLRNLAFVYKPHKMPVKVPIAQINIKNNSASFKGLNAILGTMPIFANGKINNIIDCSGIELSVFAKPNQKFLDYIYNIKALYPIKLKGNVSLLAFISGNINKLTCKSNIKLNKDSTLYYMGASVNSNDAQIGFSINSIIEPNRITLKNFSYEKYISNRLISKLMNISGQLFVKNNTILFNNLKIITYVPTDMKIFNIIFKKPFIKKGVFNSDLIINGSLNEPSIRGTLDLIDIDIPFLDASIKNISLKFLQNNIIANIVGNALENDFKLHIDMLNRLKQPYIINNAKLEANKLNLNTIFEAINNYEISAHSEVKTDYITEVDLKQLLIKKFLVTAKEIFIKNNNVKDLIANVSLNSGILKIDRFKFNLAKGEMDGFVSYNINNKASNCDLNVVNVDANELSSSLFDVNGQIYGGLDGQINLSCKGDNHAACLKSLAGHVAFRVKDGKMPKLGSLEYLLRAGNLLKSGITGLSVNNIIELIIPLKTGSFDEIKGTISINNGIADKIQIISNSKELNLFVIGEYDLTSKIADMYVFGRLSKKISNILGPVGNLSLNTLFNTIPGINLNTSSDTGLINGINKIPGLELSNKLFRVFAAEIHGDISGEDYVESFRWIE